MTGRPPDFNELVGDDVTVEERDRLRHVHDLLVQAGPPPELSPELESVQWPEEALAPLTLSGRRREQRRRSPVLVAAAIATLAVAAFLFGQATGDRSASPIDVQRVVHMAGTNLEPGAIGTLELGTADRQGNWPMILHVTGLRQLPNDGYYDLYLSRRGKPIALCGSFNVVRGDVAVRMSAAYTLDKFDGWVVTRQVPPNHEPKFVVMRTTGSTGASS
jgi:hypothetical protein